LNCNEFEYAMLSSSNFSRWSSTSQAAFLKLKTIIFHVMALCKLYADKFSSLISENSESVCTNYLNCPFGKTDVGHWVLPKELGKIGEKSKNL